MSITLYFPMLARMILPGLLLYGSPFVAATTFRIDSPSTELVGELRSVIARDEDTLMDIARAQGMGHGEMVQANPTLSIWLPGEGRKVLIPEQFLLPDAPREGIVLNRGEMRLYYYQEDARSGQQQVTTYPVGIGRDDRQTPVGRTHVTMKLENPAWYPTAAVKADYAARGKSIPGVIPPGPDNPLGQFALVLDIPGYLIHGTNRPDGIGMRVSQGCVRLYPEHIEALVRQVPKGTAVTIVDQPNKLGLVYGQLLVEVHPAVYGERQQTPAEREQSLIRDIASFMDRRGAELSGEIDWARVTEAARLADGMPTVVSYQAREAEGGAKQPAAVAAGR